MIDETDNPLPTSRGTEYARIVACAIIATSKPKRARAIVRELHDRFHDQATFAEPLRPLAGEAALIRFHREMLTIYAGHEAQYLALLKV